MRLLTPADDESLGDAYYREAGRFQRLGWLRNASLYYTAAAKHWEREGRTEDARMARIAAEAVGERGI